MKRHLEDNSSPSAGNSRISAEPTARFILAHLKAPVFCLFPLIYLATQS